jgi:hypothetical protein
VIDKLINNFPGIFGNGEFYNNSFGLRCLLDGKTTQPHNFINAMFRASVIIELLFSNREIYFVLSFLTQKSRDTTKIEKELDELLEGVDKELIECNSSELLDLEEATTRIDYLYKAKLSKEQLFDLLWIPLGSDFGHLFKKKRCYQIHIIDLEWSTSFYPYDDRGADILCADLETYRKTYKKVESYLLTFDLELMKQRLQF